MIKKQTNKNYRDALDWIKNKQPQLDGILKAWKLKTDDLERYLDDERRYLDGDQREGGYTAIAVSAEYVQLLDKLASAE
jgi:hypothetical protein